MEEALALCGSLGRWDVVEGVALRERRARGQIWGKGKNRKLYLRPGQLETVHSALQQVRHPRASLSLPHRHLLYLLIRVVLWWLCVQASCEAVYIDTILSPMQANNLTRRLGAPIYDRHGPLHPPIHP